MHVEEENTPHLKQWIVPRLEKISDADSDVLADYVIALVKADDSDDSVKRSSIEALGEFLHDNTARFVDELISAVHDKSFIPGYIPPRPPTTLSAQAPAFNPPTGPASGSNRQANLPGLGGGMNMGRGDQSRKRTREGSESRDSRDPHYGRDGGGDRQTAKMRRGGRHGRGGFGGNMGGMPSLNGMPNLPPMPGNMQQPAGFPQLDPNNPVAVFSAMQAMGFPLPALPPLPNAGTPPSFGKTGPSRRELPPGRKERCRDYDNKGYCALGSVCPYEHGADHIIVPPSADGIFHFSFNQQARGPFSHGFQAFQPFQPFQPFQNRSEVSPFSLPQNFQQLSFNQPNTHSSLFNTNLAQPFGADSAVPEYDPNQASLAVNPSLNGRGANRGAGRGRGRGDRGGFVGNRNRASFSHAGPMFDRTNTTIVVEQIPEQNFDEKSVRTFFSEFGDILEVEMQAYKRLAIVQFQDHASAQRAYDSPKVIFDNRFVKVYWYKPEALPTPRVHTNGKDTSPPEPKVDTEMLDPAEVEKKQAEAQKAYEEKQKKRQEADSQREEVEKKLKEADERRKKLLERIAAKTGGKIGGTDSTVSESPTSQTALAKELAALQAEAKSLGIKGEDGTDGATEADANLTQVPGEDTANGTGHPPAFGRGRGGYRGRGTFVPRGRGYTPFRGSYRGRGGFPATSSFGAKRGGIVRLDNRPKRVVVAGIESGTPKDEALRQHLVNAFDYESIEQHPDQKDAQVISFKERWVAEKFMNEVSSLPDIGKVEVSWMPNPPVAAAPSAPKPDQATTDNDTKMEEQANGGADAEMGGGEGDYDVADDEDRWMAEEAL